MRTITKTVVGVFNQKLAKSSGNTRSNGTELFLHGNKIADWRADGLWITDAGWNSTTTKDRLNGIPGVKVCQSNYKWFLNGQEWDGNWIKV